VTKTPVDSAEQRIQEKGSRGARLFRIRLHFIARCTLHVTPAMAAGVTDRLWEVSELVPLIQAEERGLERAA
jgi:hypothetical protein